MVLQADVTLNKVLDTEIEQQQLYEEIKNKIIRYGFCLVNVQMKESDLNKMESSLLERIQSKTGRSLEEHQRMNSKTHKRTHKFCGVAQIDTYPQKALILQMCPGIQGLFRSLLKKDTVFNAFDIPQVVLPGEGQNYEGLHVVPGFSCIYTLTRQEIYGNSIAVPRGTLIIYQSDMFKRVFNMNKSKEAWTGIRVTYWENDIFDSITRDSLFLTANFGLFLPDTGKDRMIQRRRLQKIKDYVSNEDLQTIEGMIRTCSGRPFPTQLKWIAEKKGIFFPETAEGKHKCLHPDCINKKKTYANIKTHMNKMHREKSCRRTDFEQYYPARKQDERKKRCVSSSVKSESSRKSDDKQNCTTPRASTSGFIQNIPTKRSVEEVDSNEDVKYVNFSEKSMKNKVPHKSKNKMMKKEHKQIYAIPHSSNVENIPTKRSVEEDSTDDDFQCDKKSGMKNTQNRPSLKSKIKKLKKSEEHIRLHPSNSCTTKISKSDSYEEGVKYFADRLHDLNKNQNTGNCNDRQEIFSSHETSKADALDNLREDLHLSFDSEAENESEEGGMETFKKENIISLQDELYLSESDGEEKEKDNLDLSYANEVLLSFLKPDDDDDDEEHSKPNDKHSCRKMQDPDGTWSWITETRDSISQMNMRTGRLDDDDEKIVDSRYGTASPSCSNTVKDVSQHNREDLVNQIRDVFLPDCREITKEIHEVCGSNKDVRDKYLSRVSPYLEEFNAILSHTSPSPATKGNNFYCKQDEKQENFKEEKENKENIRDRFEWKLMPLTFDRNDSPYGWSTVLKMENDNDKLKQSMQEHMLRNRKQKYPTKIPLEKTKEENLCSEYENRKPSMIELEEAVIDAASSCYQPPMHKQLMQHLPSSLHQPSMHKQLMQHLPSSLHQPPKYKLLKCEPPTYEESQQKSYTLSEKQPSMHQSCSSSKQSSIDYQQVPQPLSIHQHAEDKITSESAVTALLNNDSFYCEEDDVLSSARKQVSVCNNTQPTNIPDYISLKFDTNPILLKFDDVHNVALYRRRQQFEKVNLIRDDIFCDMSLINNERRNMVQNEMNEKKFMDTMCFVHMKQTNHIYEIRGAREVRNVLFTVFHCMRLQQSRSRTNVSKKNDDICYVTECETDTVEKGKVYTVMRRPRIGYKITSQNEHIYPDPESIQDRDTQVNVRHKQTGWPVGMQRPDQSGTTAAKTEDFCFESSNNNQNKRRHQNAFQYIPRLDYEEENSFANGVLSIVNIPQSQEEKTKLFADFLAKQYNKKCKTDKSYEKIEKIAAQIINICKNLAKILEDNKSFQPPKTLQALIRIHECDRTEFLCDCVNLIQSENMNEQKEKHLKKVVYNDMRYMKGITESDLPCKKCYEGARNIGFGDIFIFAVVVNNCHFVKALHYFDELK
jgi:hypothetical protein